MTSDDSCAAILASMRQYGFAVLNDLGQQLLDASQAEAAAALEQAEARICADSCGTGLETIARQTGCIFQVLPDLTPQHQARSSAHYWQLRSAWPQHQAVAAFLQSPPLVALLQAVLGSSQVLLYNEQYIIKPPNVNLASAFGWHYDSQYACSTGRRATYSPYLSLWVALDDMTAQNGCLVMLPGARGPACSCISKNAVGSSEMANLHVSSTKDCTSQLANLQQLPPEYTSVRPNVDQQQQPQQQWQGPEDWQQSVQQEHASTRPDMGKAVLSAAPPAQCATQHACGCEEGQSKSSSNTTHGTCHTVDSPQQGSAAVEGCSQNLRRQQQCNHLQPVGLLMPAGTAVLFWDDLWHCSGTNSSSHTRAAYMAQFSSQPLTWEDTGELVGLAVPLAAA